MQINESPYLFSQADQEELDKLVSILELSSGTTIIFAIALESSPQHPVVKQLKTLLSASEDDFQPPENFFYSDNSLSNFLNNPALQINQQISQAGRKIILAFGIDQLPTPRLSREMKQLNLGRESLFGRNLVLIFWLNKAQFLDEFRHRAPDFWDWRGKIVKFEARPRSNPLFYPYLGWLIAENSHLKISGVMQVQRQVDIFIDQIYVSLKAERRQEISETVPRVQRQLSGHFRQSGSKVRQSSSRRDAREFIDYSETKIPDFIPSIGSTKTVKQQVDLSQAIRDNQYSVILGDPGAGKTTLLRYLALHFATAKRDNNQKVIAGEEQEELGEALLPIFFRIADYAEQQKRQPDLSLLDYLRQFYRQWEAYFQTEAEVDAKTEVAELLLNAMRQGQCLMLLDGLDEVFDQESRRLIVEKIDQFVDNFPQNKFVITSRIAGYRDVKLSSNFAEFTIEDMAESQVEKFLHRWCWAVEKAQQSNGNEEQYKKVGNQQAKDILNAIKNNEGVKRLAANPLLLTILTLIYRNGSRFPNRRVEIYDFAVKTLTQDWQLSKKIPDATNVVLKESEVVELLAPLAYWMHEEKPSGLVTQAEVEDKLAKKFAEFNATEPDSDLVRQAVAEFLRKVRETTGLFVERAPEVYGFMHLTFEEYFAARYIAKTDQISETLSLIRSHLYEPRWDEPILLALGYLSGKLPRQVDNLVEQLFSSLDAYQPAIQNGKIKIKNSSSPDATLIRSDLADELKLKELLFAGRVLAEVEVNNSLRKKLINKLVLTFICLDTQLDDDVSIQLLRLMRQIELFERHGEVIVQLQQAANDSTIAEEIQIKIKLAILYIACGEPGENLVSSAIDIVSQLDPDLFCGLRYLVAKLGEEMIPALETCLQNYKVERENESLLIFFKAMSYMRPKNHEKAIEIFQQLNDLANSQLSAYISWSLATCHQENEQCERANHYYQECFEKLALLYTTPSDFLCLWRDRGICHRLYGKYDLALNCFQKMLVIARENNKSKDEALAFYHIGIAYQNWGKYEQAILYFQQSRDVYQQLAKDTYVANLWNWLADCYREWGKYEQAVECELQDLAIRQQLNDQPKIADAYYQLGRIYQNWGKYEPAIAYFQQSRDLYQQLAKDSAVANLWYWLGDCYREWGKYEQAVECQQQCLTIRQTIDDQPVVALAYYQLGRIYQNWGKYEPAIAYHQQSRDLYHQLGKDSDVANLWYWLADCYREWGKYEQALECEQQDLAIRQQLDDQPKIADAYYQLGRIYHNWGKYEQAIAYFQQSRDLYQQLAKDSAVANLWYWLGDCYREWGKYEQAVECQQQCLTIRQTIDDQPVVALAYYQLGRIYQNWGKYEPAIAYHQQSRDLYQQLGKDSDVANQCYNLADCYREWGRYEQAVECEQQDLAIRQQLNDQPNIADAYYQLGQIYQNWGKYEEAIAYNQKSSDLYHQLAKDSDRSCINALK